MAFTELPYFERPSPIRGLLGLFQNVIVYLLSLVVVVVCEGMLLRGICSGLGENVVSLCVSNYAIFRTQRSVPFINDFLDVVSYCNFYLTMCLGELERRCVHIFHSVYERCRHLSLEEPPFCSYSP